MIRRQQWLSAAAPEDASASQEAPPVPAQASSRDKYGVDLNEFKMLLGKKPRDWMGMGLQCARLRNSGNE